VNPDFVNSFLSFFVGFFLQKVDSVLEEPKDLILIQEFNLSIFLTFQSEQVTREPKTSFNQLSFDQIMYRKNLCNFV
jgi:hypothetical protein